MIVSPTIPPKLTPTGWALLLLLSLLWGGSFFFVGVAVKVLPPFTIVALRVGLASLALLTWLHLSGRRLAFAGPVIIAFILMGVLNNLIPFTLLAWGQTQISSALASILNATTPLFTVLVAHGWTVAAVEHAIPVDRCDRERGDRFRAEHQRARRN